MNPLKNQEMDESLIRHHLVMLADESVDLHDHACRDLLHLYAL